MADTAPEQPPERPADVLEYFDGERTRYGDAYAVRRLLRLHLFGEHQRVLADAAYKPPPGGEPDPERQRRAEAAVSLLLEAGRKALKMKPHGPDGTGGATDVQVLEALRRFVACCEAAEGE